MTLGPAFRRLYAATAASDFADGIGRTALPLAAASYTRDPLAVSGLLTFAFLPWLLFALPSGALVDRLDRRIAMAVANAARATASVVLVVVVLTGAGGIAALYAVSFALGVAETVYDSAVRALLPQVVGRADLDRANSLLTVEETLGQTFVGAPLGSALFGAAVALPFVLNAVGFALAVVLILGLRGSFRPVRAAVPGAAVLPVTSIRADVVEGVRWLRGHDLLRGLTAVSAGTAGVSSMITGVLVLYVLEVLRLPAGAFGYVLLAGGVGALLGGLTVAPLARRLGRPVVLTGGSVLCALAGVAMGLTTNGVLASVFFALSSAGVMAWNVLTMSLRQALIPTELFGRVQGAYRTVVWGAIPVGSLAGGVLAGWLGVGPVFVVTGALELALAFRLAVLLRRHRAQVARSADVASADFPSAEAATLSPGS